MRETLVIEWQQQQHQTQHEWTNHTAICIQDSPPPLLPPFFLPRHRCSGWFSFNPIDDLLADPQCHVGECPTCSNHCRYENAHHNSFLFHLETDPHEKVGVRCTLDSGQRGGRAYSFVACVSHLTIDHASLSRGEGEGGGGGLRYGSCGRRTSVRARCMSNERGEGAERGCCYLYGK